MSTFIGGPANGMTLRLRRAPICLRVVQDQRTSNWDALDQLSDIAAIYESVHVYILVGNPSRYHLCCRPSSNGGYFEDGEYHWFPEQPAPPGSVHPNWLWAKWCEDNTTKVLAFRSAER